MHILHKQFQSQHLKIQTFETQSLGILATHHGKESTHFKMHPFAGFGQLHPLSDSHPATQIHNTHWKLLAQKAGEGGNKPTNDIAWLVQAGDQ